MRAVRILCRCKVSLGEAVAAIPEVGDRLTEASMQA